MNSIVTKANSLIKKTGTSCPFKIAESLGIQIQYENLGNTLGYYSCHFRIKIIHINEQSSEGRKRFICAHELGHAVVHPNANTPFLKKHTLFSTERIEVEANHFAINLLFSNLHDDTITIDDALNYYGIPKKFVLSHLDTSKKFYL